MAICAPSPAPSPFACAFACVFPGACVQLGDGHVDLERVQAITLPATYDSQPMLHAEDEEGGEGLLEWQVSQRRTGVGRGRGRGGQGCSEQVGSDRHRV